MARSHARLLVSIWRDPDWLALSPAGKLLYVTVLSQPRLTLVGCIDWSPGRWAALSGVSRDHTDRALDELRAGRFLILDEGTEECLVRSMVKNDVDPNRVNVNLAKGLWGQWEGIVSPLLRSVAVHEIPGPLWDRLEPHAPDDALQTRRSARLEPEPLSRSATETPVPVGNPSLLSTLSSHLPRVPEGVPVRADFQHHPTPKIEPAQREELTSNVRALRSQTFGLPDPTAADRSTPVSPLPPAGRTDKGAETGGAA